MTPPAPPPPATGAPAPATRADAFVLDVGGRSLLARPGRAHVVGVLNVTPDSFSDGGRYLDADAALFRAEQMLEEGAAVLDVGGESTRPAGRTYGAGAAAVAAREERERVVPVVEAITRRFPEALVSVDTYKAGTARAALDAGAHLVNDVAAGRYADGTGETTLDVAAAFSVPVILMHARGLPGALEHEGPAPAEGVVEAVRAFLKERAGAAEAAGVPGVVVDPGFGFGKTPAANLKLIAGTDRLVALGYPVMVAVSRKSTVGVLLGSEADPAPVDERLYGGLGLAAAAVLKGASLVRTHDVHATAELIRALEAVHPAREAR